MNEIKRQLNKKLGDTTSYTNTVIQKIEQNKRGNRVSIALKTSNAPIYMAITTIVAVLAVFLLVGPFAKDSNLANPVKTPPINDPSGDEQDSSYKNLLRSYFFKANGDVAYFQGIGNEYATFTETTTWISNDYIATVIDNGGGQTLTIHRLTDNSIEVVVEEMQEEGVALPTVEKLEKMPALYKLIEAPFDKEQSNGKTIKLNVPFKTPYGEVKALVIEEKFEENNSITKDYYAEKLGLVGTTYEVDDNISVASYLSSINVAPTPDNDLTINVYNESTKQTDNYPIEKFVVIDPYLYKMNPTSYAMTYRALHKTNAAELGVFSYHCDDEESCSYILVTKAGKDFTILRHLSGSYGNLRLSPDKNYAIIPFHRIEKGESTVIERDVLALIDLRTMTFVIPNHYPEYFEEAVYPIQSFHFLNNTSIEIETADVTSSMHDDLYKWKISPKKPTKKVIVELQ